MGDKEEFNCKSCTNADNEDMVQCDSCNDWHHFECVGANADIEDKDWYCPKCIQLSTENPGGAPLPNPELASQTNEPVDPNANDQDSMSGVNKSRPMTSNKRRASMVKQRALILEQLEEERRLKEQRDQEYIEKKYTMLRQLEIDTSDSDTGESHIENGNKKPNAFAHERGSTPVSHAGRPKSTTVHLINQSTIRPESGTVPNTNVTYQHGNLTKATANATLTVTSNTTSGSNSLTYSVPMLHTNPYASCSLSMNPPIQSTKLTNTYTSYSNPATKTADTASPLDNATVNNATASNYFMPVMRTEEFVPTKAQMAARHVMVKGQVLFSGRPEDWPMFISWYNSTTLACGYTNSDNLQRLQSCLKGEALENVKFRLFIPDQVPGVINTLTRLYGRSDVIIDSLVDKMRNEPPIREDKLQSIIKFSLTIENICGVMMATGLHKHLADPSLLRELVDKLPPILRLDWGHYSRTVSDVDISVYSSWLADKAYSASIVTPLNSIKAINKPGKSSSRALLNIHQKSSSTNELNCLICQQDCRTVEHCEEFANMNLKERWDAVKRSSICRTCLRAHGRKRCYIDKACGINGCIYKHHKMLHNAANDHREQMTVSQQTNLFHKNYYTSILFKIVPVVLYNNNKEIKTFAFLDDGSSISLIDEDLARELNAEGELQPLYLKWTSNTHRTENGSQKIKLEISSSSTDKRYKINLRTVSHLDLPNQSVDVERLSNKYPYLNGLPIKTYFEAKPRLLIGLDQWKLCVPLRSKEGKENQPIASKTRLGWSIYGPCTRDDKPCNRRQSFANFHICECQQNEDKNLSELFKNYIAIDTMGLNTMKTIRSHDDEAAISILEKSIYREAKHYVVPLLWKLDNKEMPDSRQMAERRLICLEKKMSKDVELYNKLNAQIEEYVRKQYARKLTKKELRSEISPVWYLPVFPVTNPNKPEKVRMVWDAAACVGNISLNSMLFSGPDIVPSLPSVLFKFRERRIAICADIKEMFHQVNIRQSDQHAQRFLWRNKTTNRVEEYIMQVMTFGSTCSPFCAQFVKNLNANKFKAKYPRAVQGITERHYVDDYLDSVDSEEEAIQLAKEVIVIHNEAGFYIRNFMSNSAKVLVSVKERAANYDHFEGSQQILPGSEKILGLWWSPRSDSFSFAIRTHNLKYNLLLENAWPTKREMLRVLMSIFDPLGLIANFLIFLKILLQEVWSSGIEWDQKILPQHYEK
ncbi:uncharacterized protein LOC129909789 [Episyrphus balteatus]|uniref:uncharacterized protein LOC129909789 n=1 Tax=Episyrphus balteatus TaxID=286459 RepID=UPI002484E747|nr:uncharacterized protein LOC129909789 [Episyrphus balteatus]